MLATSRAYLSRLILLVKNTDKRFFENMPDTGKQNATGNKR
jgi:hypothetical protein